MVYKILQKNSLKELLLLNGFYALGLSLFVLFSHWDKSSFFSALLLSYLYAFLFYFSLLWLFKKRWGAWFFLAFKYLLIFLFLMFLVPLFDSSALLMGLSPLLFLILSYSFYQMKEIL